MGKRLIPYVTPKSCSSREVWWDVISIPPGTQTTKDGKPVVVPGHIKMRSRFDDFYGRYVLHCHILGHEDRGMMEVVEVVNNATVVTHH